MGGDYYDRPVLNVEEGQQETKKYSVQAAKVIDNTEPHKSLDPLVYAQEPLKSTVKNPIVIALDVTGSMGDWTYILYDKMPMFYGQLLLNEYVTETAISICAIGDHKIVKCPLQVAKFGQGVQVDEFIAKLYMADDGGGNHRESYELAGYFYLKNCKLVNCEMPYFFITGDEGFWPELEKSTISKFLGLDQNNQNSIAIWKELNKKFHVFLLRKRYYGQQEPIIQAMWVEALGADRVLSILDPKACVDTMLGAVAISSGKKTLEGFLEDLNERGQSAERIEQVRDSLKLVHKLPQIITEQEQIVVEEEKSNSEKMEISIQQARQFIIQQQQVEGKHIIDQHVQGVRNAPDEFYCPLTQHIFVHPVTALDGFTYEEEAIKFWLTHHNTSPMTGLQIPQNLMKNGALQNIIKTFNEGDKQK